MWPPLYSVDLLWPASLAPTYAHVWALATYKLLHGPKVFLSIIIITVSGQIEQKLHSDISCMALLYTLSIAYACL